MEGYKQVAHQAAGHPGALVDSSSGELFAKLSCQQEIDFYTQVSAKELTDDEGHEYLGSSLYDWMPKFLGRLDQGITKDLENSSMVNQRELEQAKQDLEAMSIGEDSSSSNSPMPIGDKPYVVLQNLLFGFNKPSIIDIKLGAKLTDPKDPTISEDKHQRLAKVSTTTTSGSWNIRICGMKTFDNYPQATEAEYDQIVNDQDVSQVEDPEAPHKNYVVFNKFFGRNLTTDNIKLAFRLFFFENQLDHVRQVQVLQKMIDRLQVLHNCLIDTEARMFSSSIFMVFENDLDRWNNKEEGYEDPLIREDFEDSDDDDEEEKEEISRNKGDTAPLSSLNMIDFAHSRLAPKKGCDDNVLDGVENLLKIFEELLNDSHSFCKSG
ncbi:inositol polyphosphate multikinase [Saccharomycopsis crataegensis]|uniref:Kinase n=1 Tax=Saccharomycopsis crataegensis TaxID=43959 RepID=A0AAV5QUS6_9ASCO|nr:inositol polyphosphate multikinase [Saccharomycopsis crataegensis]